MLQSNYFGEESDREAMNVADLQDVFLPCTRDTR